MYKIVEFFKDILPPIAKQKNKYEPIGDPQIPESMQIKDRKYLESGGVQHALFDFGIEFENIAQLIFQYNQFARIDFVEEAIDEIVDESIVLDDFNPVIELDLSSVDVNESAKKKIVEEFDYLKTLLKFDSEADEHFRTWYIDGRYYLQPIFEKNKSGIVKFHKVSPYKIQRFFDKNTQKYMYFIRGEENDYFLKRKYYDPDDKTDHDYIVSSDHIIFVPSGLTDAKKQYYISHLHKALKPANQLKLLEDSLVVYRFSRAPERRAFYIDVGRLSSKKAEEFVQKLMNKFKTKMSYDMTTGMTNQNKSIMTMLEDYWLPRSNGKGTEVQTISGGTQLGEITDVLYFKRRAWRALKIPPSRADDENSPTIDFGRDDFSRDELKFNRFCKKLRSKFSELFTQALRIQLIHKKICNEEEWRTIYEPEIKYNWNESSYWVEQKENAILEKRLRMLRDVKDYPEFFPSEYINKRILRRSDDDIEEIKKQYEEDLKNKPKESDDERGRRW